jgi:starvation-inducible DNA-binding protein
MVKTRNDLPSNARSAMIALLNARLVDAIDLRLALKQAHWNIKGPNFIALHEMLDAMQQRVDVFADEIAERGVALGGVVAGTTQAVADGSKLAAYPAEIIAEADHLKALADRLATFGKLAREAIDAADDAGDKDTADLFTAVSRQVDKDLWFIEAHLH